MAFWTLEEANKEAEGGCIVSHGGRPVADVRLLQLVAVCFQGEGEGQDEGRNSGVTGCENEEVLSGELGNGPRVAGEIIGEAGARHVDLDGKAGRAIEKRHAAGEPAYPEANAAAV